MTSETDSASVDLPKLRAEFEGIIATYRQALRVSSAEIDRCRVTLRNAEHVFDELRGSRDRWRRQAVYWRGVSFAQLSCVLGGVAAVLAQWGWL